MTLPPIRFSVFTAKHPLSKQIAADGTVTPAMPMGSGHVQVFERPTLEGYADVRASLNSNQAIGYGVPKGGVTEALIVTKAARKVQMPDPNGLPVITRTRADFEWPVGYRRIGMIDYDPFGLEIPMDPQQLVDALRGAVAYIRHAELMWTPSASSFVAANGQLLSGLKGQRIYTVLDPAVNPEDFGERMTDLLWMEGHGRVVPSKSGSALYRTLCDSSVYQPERLDFAGPPVCAQGVQSDAMNPNHRWFSGQGDVQPLGEDVGGKIAELGEKARKAARRDAEAKLQDAREQWVKDRMADTEGVRPETLRTAVMAKTLMADFILHLDKHGPVTVSDVLANREKYHGATGADPLEPDYGGGVNKAKLFLDGAGARYYSQAHGGQTFRLRLATTSVRVGDNADPVASVDQTVTALAEDETIFRTGNEIMRVVPVGSDVMPQALCETGITLVCETLCRFFREQSTKEGPVQIQTVMPRDLTKKVEVKATQWLDSPMRPLTGVVSEPTIDGAGRIVQTPGYDRPTGLLYHPRMLPLGETRPTVPDHPTKEDAIAALTLLHAPFSRFKFEDDGNRSWTTLMAAMLTAVIRPNLPTAPGYLFTAPQAGSGKTKLMQCVSLMAGGGTGCLPFPKRKEELAKQLASLLRESPRSLNFDNLVGVLDGGQDLTAVLTSTEWSARELGVTRILKVLTNCMFMFTGNNVSIYGDMNRRALKVKVKPVSATPYRESFGFDPVREVAHNRHKLNVAALTIIRAYMVSQQPVGLPPFGSFEDWSRMVRDPLVWLGYPDIIDGIQENYEDDEETNDLVMLHDIWETHFGDSHVTNQQIDAMFSGTGFGEELQNMFGGNGAKTARWLKREFSNHEGRMVDGRGFSSKGKNTARKLRWLVGASKKV